MNELTSGSTWHAAGNCPTFSGSWTVMKMQAYGASLYRRLSAELDGGIGYHGTGSLRLAHHRERMDEFRHVKSMAQAQGLAYELLSPAQARELYPFLEPHDLECVLWDPLDGDVDPSQLTQAYARHAREAGCRIDRFTRVTSLARGRSGEWLVGTDKGETIRAEIVVNAAGYRAGEIMAMVGQHLPIVSMQHQYLVTEDIPALLERGREKLPLLRDPDVSYYLRQERQGFILGPYEWQCRAEWPTASRPTSPISSGPTISGGSSATSRMPAPACRSWPRVGSSASSIGPIPYAPDGNPYIGPAHGLTNFYQCCCFSFGIAQSAGAGKFLSEWVVDGAPEWDGWVFDPRRYTGYATATYTTAKAVELYQNEYAVGFPFEERPAGRPARTTPLYPVLQAKGARFGARNGWERALYFDPEGRDRRADLDPAPRAQLERPGARRGQGRARGGRRDRSRRLLQVHARGSGCRADARSPALLAPAQTRPDRAVLRPRRQGWRGQRADGHAAGRGPLLSGLRQHGRMARRGSPARRLAGRWQRPPGMPAWPPRYPGGCRSRCARGAAAGDPGRSLQCRLSLAVGARH